MGNFSRDTFDRLKRYVGVRLQQGVPIVDADWNEMEDICKYELRAFIRWFLGDGVPEGNGGFAIGAVGDSNDFSIRGGDATAEGAGHCLVDGWDVINVSPLRYAEQILLGNPSLANDWGVDPVPPLTTPGANRNDLVYLDVWEREVDSTEDSDLINPAIGIETAVRLKREWAVRVVEGSTTLPAPGAGHAFYALAMLRRTGGNADIGAGAIEDLRRTGLNLATLEAEVAAVEAEIADARGTRVNLGNRLDQSLAAGGALRQNVVGNQQVPDGGLSESKIQFSATGHDHSGGGSGNLISTSGLADDAVTEQKVNFEIVNTGTIADLDPGETQERLVNDEYDGRLYFPALTNIEVDPPAEGSTTANVTAQLVYRRVEISGEAPSEKSAVLLRVTSDAGNTGPADVTWHVYAFGEE